MGFVLTVSAIALLIGLLTLNAPHIMKWCQGKMDQH